MSGAKEVLTAGSFMLKQFFKLSELRKVRRSGAISSVLVVTNSLGALYLLHTQNASTVGH